MKIIPLIILSLAFPALTCNSSSPTPAGKDKKYPSVYKPGIVVDGNSAEWENSLFLFNSASQVAYAVANDSAALYVCIRVANEPEQMKIAKNGLEIVFNSAGKKKPEADIHFPIGGGRMNERLGPVSQNHDPNQSERPDRKRIHMVMLLQMQDMELSGYKEGVNGFQNCKSGKNGISAAISWDSTNTMVYEARIPLKVFREDVSNAQPLAFGILIKGTPKPREGAEMHDPGQQGGMQGGQPGQGHGGMREGGIGHEQALMESNDMKQFEDDSIWRMISIAKKE